MLVTLLPPLLAKTVRLRAEARIAHNNKSNLVGGLMSAPKFIHPERFQPHLFTKSEQFPWRYIDDLPLEWSHLICKCDRFNYVTQHDNPFKQPPRCGTCGKAPITHFCKCKACGTFYIRNFSHPEHCNYCEQRCWDCSEAAVGKEPPCCDANNWKRQKYPNSKRPPRGRFEPAKKYTDEELYTLEDFTLD